MASGINSLLGASTAASSAASPQNSNTVSSSTLGAASNEQMFLQLLVSQLKNQDPLNPVDGTQFVSQLSQFSELEQLIAIRGDIENPSANNSSNATGANSGSNVPGATSAATNPAGASSPTPPAATAAASSGSTSTNTRN